MKILVLNCGSSSLKYQLIDMASENALAKGLVERIGIAGSRLVHQKDGEGKVTVEAEISNHDVAVKLVMDALMDVGHGVIGDISEIGAAGHRVVHGGEFFTASALVTAEVKKAISDCVALAPLHNPANLIGIEACEKLMPNTPQVAVFDTAFHQTMPEKAYLYAIPYSLYDKYKIRKYGFHGTSHKYVTDRAASMLGKPIEKLKLISCHLGNGASVCAVDGGKSVDTSMGLTPLEGLMMGTRSGDMDPAAVAFIMDKEGMTTKQMENLLNKESGVLGISGVSSDFRDIEAAVEKGDAKAKTALDMYHYRVAKYIGSYATAMNGVDAVIFTAGVGENGPETREAICEYLGYLGVAVDAEKNKVRGKERDFSADSAKVRSLVIPTNEELVIARDTLALCKK
ncbi:MAG: acetate kinase [Defluviitaleaceae bacterium]|nr:acetate kinase [Defluviitaleaceae bacterium]